MKIRNKKTGQIVEVPDSIQMEPMTIKGETYTDESQATFMERAKAGLAPEKTRVKAWEGMLGVGNVKQTPEGDILIRKGGQWGPVEGENWTPSEILGDIADYSGELLEDIGAGAGAALGAVKGTAVLPGIGTVAGISAGGGAGRALGNVARQGLAEMAGVQGYDGERLPEIGMSALEGAIVEPIGFGVGKGIAAGAKMAAPYAKKIVEEPMRFGTKYVYGALSAKNPKLIETLLKEEGPDVYAKFKQGTPGYLKTISEAKEIPNKLYEQANKRYTQELGENGIDMSVTADNKPLFDALLQVREHLDLIPDAEGAIPSLTAIDSDEEIKYLTNKLPKLLAEVTTPKKAMTLKKQIGNKLKSLQYWTKPDSDKTAFEHSLSQIYNAADDVVELSAIQQGKGDQYAAAKSAYKERKQLADNLARSLRTDKATNSAIAGLEGRTQLTLLDDLSKATELEPELLSPVLKDMLYASRAVNMDAEIGSMDASRVGKSIFDVMQNPYAKVGTFLATRPAIGYPSVVKAGQGISAIGDIAESATKGLATPIGEQVSREAVRVGSELPVIGERTGLSEREIESAIIENAPSIVDYAKNHYGANFKRATDQGVDEATAAFMVVADQLRKGNKNVIGAFGDMATDSGMGDDRFGNTVANILDRYTGIQ